MSTIHFKLALLTMIAGLVIMVIGDHGLFRHGATVGQTMLIVGALYLGMIVDSM